jgi:hypoxanthine phosphoribosyltransferase
MNKRFITASELLKDSFSLGMKILESDFRPSFIIGVWRGGAPIGIAVQEVLDVCGVTTEHIAIRTSSYNGIDQRSKTVTVHGLGYVIDTIKAEDNLLIVDDVHDSGLSVAELVKQIKLRSGDNAPQSIKVATVYFKPSQSKVSSEPDYYLHTTNDWLIFPHELQGLTAEELLENKPEVAHIIQQLQDFQS